MDVFDDEFVLGVFCGEILEIVVCCGDDFGGLALSWFWGG